MDALHTNLIPSKEDHINDSFFLMVSPNCDEREPFLDMILCDYKGELIAQDIQCLRHFAIMVFHVNSDQDKVFADLIIRPNPIILADIKMLIGWTLTKKIDKFYG